MSYLQLIGTWILAHGGKIVYALNAGIFAGMSHGWAPSWIVFAVMGGLNALAGYNAAVVQPKLQAKHELALKRQFAVEANASDAKAPAWGKTWPNPKP